MLPAVFILTFLVAIPNAFAGRTLFKVIAALTARRTQLGWGFLILLSVLIPLGFAVLGLAPIFRGGFRTKSILAHPIDALLASSLGWSLFELGLGKVPAAQIISSAIAARRHRWELSSKEQDTTGDVL